ncbi:MAG: metal ABC transporter ATP-binding protein [bacterium]
MKTIITAKDVSYSINSNLILENISFNIKEGDYIGLIGPNGAGKTTLIKIILDITKPSHGSIEYDCMKCEIGYVPQKASQQDQSFPATVEEIIETGFGKKKLFFSKKTRIEKEMFNSAIKQCGLEGVRKRLINELSGGERQRVMIARALVQNPALLILDEPATGIDIHQQENFYNLLNKLNSQGIAIILVSHDVDAVVEEVKTIMCLKQKIIHQGPAAEFKLDDLQHLYGENFKFIRHHHDHV